MSLEAHQHTDARCACLPARLPQATSYAIQQDGEAVDQEPFDCSSGPDRPMLELQAGTRVYYQASIIRESKTEIRVLFPGGCFTNQGWLTVIDPGSGAAASLWCVMGVCLACCAVPLCRASFALQAPCQQSCKRLLPRSCSCSCSWVQKRRRCRSGGSGWTSAAAGSGGVAWRAGTGGTSRAQSVAGSPSRRRGRAPPAAAASSARAVCGREAALGPRAAAAPSTARVRCRCIIISAIAGLSACASSVLLARRLRQSLVGAGCHVHLVPGSSHQRCCGPQMLQAQFSSFCRGRHRV